MLVLFLLATLACKGPADTSDSGESPAIFQAGAASSRLPVPLGVGAVGFLPHGLPPHPTPYSDLYPGTWRLHGHPEVRVLGLRKGEEELVLVLTDTYTVHQQARAAMVGRSSTFGSVPYSCDR